MTGETPVIHAAAKAAHTDSSVEARRFSSSGFFVDWCLARSGLRDMFPAMRDWLQKFFKPEQPEEVLGQRGENVAAKYLRNQGFKILVRNFRCNLGEIDIVARDGKTIVFVEVKTRVNDDPKPEEQVNNPKRHQITKAARFYMSRYGMPQPPARFDVVAIVWPTGREPQISHEADAFEATF